MNRIHTPRPYHAQNAMRLSDSFRDDMCRADASQTRQVLMAIALIILTMGALLVFILTA